MPPRCVLVLDPRAPRWLAANASAVLEASVGAAGRAEPGPDLVDASGSRWAGIAEIGIHAIALLGPGNAVRRLTRHLSALADPVPEAAR